VYKKYYNTKKAKKAKIAKKRDLANRVVPTNSIL